MIGPDSDEFDVSHRAELWRGDAGTLGAESRRAIARLVRGPYLSAETYPALWSALRADEGPIRSRLNDLFLDLVLDPELGFAFVRNAASGETEIPKVVRSQNLTVIDTAMLLVLRQMLLSDTGGGRVIVGRVDVYEQLQVYRAADRDETDFERRLNSAWRKMDQLGLVHAAGRTGPEARVEISPVLRLIIGADEVRQIRVEYDRLAAQGEAKLDIDAVEAADADDAASDGGDA